MGSESDAERQPSSLEDIRISKTSMEPVVMDVRDLAASVPDSEQIGPGSTYVSKCIGVHLGPKFVSVTKNVHKNEGIKEMPFPKYIWVVVKATTRTERIVSLAALTAVIICIWVAIYTVPMFFNYPSTSDVAPHEWNITRNMWLARPVNRSAYTMLPRGVRLVIIQHTVSPMCDKFASCASHIRNLQNYFIEDLDYDDIAYNFQVANDGRVYEGRGWGVQGAHTGGYNRCSYGIGFLGDYRDDSNMQTKVTPAQIKNVKRLFEYGVRMGYLHPDYKVLGAKDLKATASPGSNLYEEIQRWPQYDHKGQYKNKTCDEILLMNTSNKTLDIQ